MVQDATTRMPQVHKRKAPHQRQLAVIAASKKPPLTLHLSACIFKRGTWHVAKRPVSCELLQVSSAPLEVSSAPLQTCHLQLVRSCLKSGSCQSRGSYEAGVMYRALGGI